MLSLDQLSGIKIKSGPSLSAIQPKSSIFCSTLWAFRYKMSGICLGVPLSLGSCLSSCRCLASLPLLPPPSPFPNPLRSPLPLGSFSVVLPFSFSALDPTYPAVLVHCSCLVLPALTLLVPLGPLPPLIHSLSLSTQSLLSLSSHHHPIQVFGHIDFCQVLIPRLCFPIHVSFFLPLFPR